jgi:hypothetical protein
LTSDTCVIDREHFFIRGVIELPIHDHQRRFGFGVWVSQKRENFLTYEQNPDSAEIGPFFGWLCTRIASYQPADTYLLKTRACFRGGDLRPTIELEPTDHPWRSINEAGSPCPRHGRSFTFTTDNRSRRLGKTAVGSFAAIKINGRRFPPLFRFDNLPIMRLPMGRLLRRDSPACRRGKIRRRAARFRAAGGT